MRLIDEFSIVLNADNTLRSVLCTQTAPEGSRPVYTETVMGKSTYQDVSCDDDALSDIVKAVREALREIDPRWKARFAYERLRNGSRHLVERKDFHAAALEYYAVITLGKECGSPVIQIAGLCGMYKVLMSIDDHTGAQKYQQQALELAATHLPWDDQLVAKITDDAQEAEGFIEAPEVYELLLSIEPHIDSGDYERAIGAAKQAVELATEKFGNQHWMVATALRMHAIFFDGEEARAMLNRAAQIAAEWGGPDSALRQTIQRDLDELEGEFE